MVLKLCHDDFGKLRGSRHLDGFRYETLFSDFAVCGVGNFGLNNNAASHDQIAFSLQKSRVIRSLGGTLPKFTGGLKNAVGLWAAGDLHVEHSNWLMSTTGKRLCLLHPALQLREFRAFNAVALAFIQNHMTTNNLPIAQQADKGKTNPVWQTGQGTDHPPPTNHRRTRS